MIRMKENVGRNVDSEHRWRLTLDYKGQGWSVQESLHAEVSLPKRPFLIKSNSLVELISGSYDSGEMWIVGLLEIGMACLNFISLN